MAAVLHQSQRRSLMAQTKCQGRMRPFPGPAVPSPFLMRILTLLPAAALVSWQGERCCLEGTPLNIAAGNGRTWRFLAITCSVPKLVLLLIFFFTQYLILKSVMGKHKRYKTVASYSKKPNSVFSVQCENFYRSNLVKNQIRFHRNTAYSTAYTIWLHLTMKRLLIPDNVLSNSASIAQLLHFFPMSTGTLSVMIWNL